MWRSVTLQLSGLAGGMWGKGLGVVGRFAGVFEGELSGRELEGVGLPACHWWAGLPRSTSFVFTCYCALRAECMAGHEVARLSLALK